jgi:hypothetical protein
MLQKGLSLHIGLNNVDQQAYRTQGWVVPTLAGCINDAKSMQFLAAGQGFITQILTDDQASSSEVIRLVSSYGRQLQAGDIFLLTYSGHGGQVPDINGDEADGQDETWILYDRMLIDDELYQLFGQFAAGVRIVLLSDSCHSGTVAKVVTQTAVVEKYRELSAAMIAAPLAAGPALRGTMTYGARDVVVATDRASSRDIMGISRAAAASSQVRFRGIPTAMSEALYQARKREYDTFQLLAGRSKDASFGPGLILISGCQDNQLSQDGDTHGLFTQNLLDTWSSGSFQGNYREFWNRILANMPADQTPNFYTLGDVSSFQQERPFAIKTQPYNANVAPRMWIEGASSRSRGGSAPNFRVDTQAAPYYVVEFATSIELFDASNHENDRQSDNFWASWSESPVMSAQYSFYPMPNSVWNALKGASQIYYRVGTTTAEDGYPDYAVSTDDGATDGPYLTIV